MLGSNDKDEQTKRRKFQKEKQKQWNGMGIEGSKLFASHLKKI